MAIEIGISLGLSPREDIDRLVGLLRLADDLGVAAAWVIDSQLAMKDAYLALAVLARETGQLRIGPGVTNLVTRHETVVANAMATLATFAPGRVLVGLGAGDSAVFPIGAAPLSLARCEEGIHRLRALLRGDTVEGPAGNLRLSYVPDPPPPLYLAASQPRMLELAGAMADGVIVMGPSDPATVEMQLGHVAAGVRRAGRPASEPTVDLWVTMAVGDHLNEATAAVKSWASAQARWLATWKDLPASLDRYRAEIDAAVTEYRFGDHLARRAQHAASISDDFARTLAVAGPPEACTRRLSELAAFGPERITVSLLSGGRERRLRDTVEVFAALDLPAGRPTPAGPNT
jgi:5,10-methylenetetrahydromethanopterin reductase